jgi:radical SAM-linked protein
MTTSSHPGPQAHALPDPSADLDTLPNASSTEAAPGERQRLRILYAKCEAIKFISHQDEFRLWERALRRADLPLLYKQGFNPQPFIQFASPLGVGFTGLAEPLDVVLSPPVPLDDVRARLTAKLPPGVTLHSLEEIPLKAPALQGLLIGADYTITLYATDDEISSDAIRAAIARVLDATTIWRERERKGAAYRYNLRPLIFELNYIGYAPLTEEHRIFLRVQQRAGATGRPDEVVAALGFDNLARTLCRDRLYLAGTPEDDAIFAAYPIIEQQAIAGPPLPKPPRRQGAAGRHLRAPGGRSISERAGDEFA